MRHSNPAHRKRLRSAAVAALAAVWLASARVEAASSKSSVADSLYLRALSELAANTLDSRRSAVENLEAAARLEPHRAEIWLALGRASLQTDRLERGRTHLARATSLAGDDAQALLLLGSAWRWDWLQTFESSSLAEARACLVRAVELAPESSEAHTELAAIEVIRGDPGSAARHAREACLHDTTSGMAWSLLGCALFRLGRVEAADVAFHTALPWLSHDVRARFEDADWLMYAEDPPANTRGRDGMAAFWSENDPDRTTPENEAELDFRSRLALALALFRDAKRIRWDQRTELFVRYGPPAAAWYNPGFDVREFIFQRRYESSMPGLVVYTPPPLRYPYNVQLWSYPELGLHFELWDRTLSQSYLPAIAYDYDPEPTPSPEVLAARPDWVGLDGGRFVLRSIPPGTHPIEARGTIARFPSGDAVRLVAHLEVASGARDSMAAHCAFVRSDGHVVARQSQSLSVSACDPTALATASFTAELPPGAYQVDLAIDDGRRGRGLVRLDAHCPAPPPTIALSDVMLVCGDAAAAIGSGEVRVEPNITQHVEGSAPISLYFEIHHLQAGPEGLARFAYDYRVQRLDRARRRPRATVVSQTSREDTHVGSLRRQFLSVPVTSLSPGDYRLTLEVRDLVARAAATREVEFSRE